MVVSLIKQLTPVLKKIIFIIFIFLNCSVLVSSGIHQSRVAISKMFFYKSPDNNDPRANSRSMSKFVTIANWQICCFIAKFSINRQFCYKLLLGLSWGQSLHQNCKDVKLHITCLIPGLAFISPAIFFTWHNLTCVHWLTPGHTPNTTRFVIRWSDRTVNTSQTNLGRLHCWDSPGWRQCWLSHQEDHPHAVCPDINSMRGLRCN